MTQPYIPYTDRSERIKSYYASLSPELKRELGQIAESVEGKFYTARGFGSMSAIELSFSLLMLLDERYKIYDGELCSAILGMDVEKNT